MKLIAIGPLPPKDGGTTILFKQFIDYLNSSDENITYMLINTNERTALSRFGVYRLFKILFVVAFNVNKYDVLSLHLSKPSLKLLFPFVLFLAKLFRKKIVVRKFGGDFYKSMQFPSLLNKVIVLMLKKCDIVYFETKSEVKLFNEISCSNISKWMPNSRNKAKNLTLNPNIGRKFKLFNLVFFGNVTETKGILDLVEASKHIDDLRVSIYGPCSDSKLRSEIESSANCFYYGPVPSNEVASIIQRSSALCLPTYYSGEGYPGVIIEAFSVGVPVISTDWGCISEIVKHEINGLLVEIKNPALLSKAIKRLITDEILLDQLAVNAKKSFSQFNSKIVHKNILQDHINLFRD